MSLRRCLAALGCALIIGGVPAGAAAPEDTLADVRLLAEAGTRLDAAMAGDTTASELGGAISDYERALASVRDALREAGGQERALQVALAVRRDADARLLAALQARRAALPPGADLHPRGPIAAARARAMMARLDPGLSEAATELGDRLRALEATRRLQREGAGHLAVALGKLDEARTALVAGLDFVTAPGPVDGTSAAALSGSDSITELASAMSRSQSPAADRDAAGEPWLAPVQGVVLHGFLEPDAAGVRLPGQLWSAPPLSLVRAPEAGRVRYAGPFLDYQNVVVLETGDAALVVLAGLARRVVAPGDAVERGAPLGLLGGRSPEIDEYLAERDLETGAGLRESLYVEIRHGRGPVDPASWFAFGDGDKEQESAQ
jgi:murein hydrolase activator